MLYKLIVLISLSVQLTGVIAGQSLNHDSLWTRIEFISDSLKNNPAAELALLSNIEARIVKAPNSQDSSHVFLLRQMGLQYFKQGDYLNAEQKLLQSNRMILANINKAWINPDHIIINYYTLNKLYDSLGRIAKMKEAIDSCISVARRRNTINIYSLAALYKKVVYLFDVGDYNNCIDYATVCETFGKQYAFSHGKSEYEDGMLFATASLIWNINALILLKNYDAAERLLFKKMVEYKKTNAALNLGAFYYQLADVEIAKKNYKEALNYYENSFIAEWKDGEIIGCKDVLNNIAILYSRYKGNPQMGLAYFRRALALKNKNTNLVELNAVETLNILANMGHVFVQLGLYDSAFRCFRLAFDQIRPGISETELLSIKFDEFAKQKKIGYLTGLLLDEADAYLHLFKETSKLSAVKEAVRIYKLTDQLLDRVKSEQSDIQSKLFWRSDSRHLYENAIEACYNYNNIEDAFYFFEKSKAVLLNDQLKEKRWLGEEDIRRQTQISKKLAQIKDELLGINEDSIHFKELQNELFSNKQELNRLIELIKNRDPLYYQSFIDLNAITVKDIQKSLLSDHHGLLETFWGDSAVYFFTVTNGPSNFVKIRKGTFDSLSNAYMSYISNISKLNSEFDEFVRVSRSLFQLIFANTNAPQGRMYISPDGQYFPFEALISNISGPPRYLVYDCAISYTYSARYLTNYFSTQDNHLQDFLGIAPVQFPDKMGLASLSGSDLSLLRIQSHFNETDELVAQDATKAGFTEKFLNYKVIQLYTHAIDSGKNGEPVIYFRDSALNLSDLVGNDKSGARLIVLSACETGRGKLYKGEGVFSFNRGFAALGIPSSITNLWSVDDVSSYRLTELFYKFLAEQMPIDVALQKAKVEFIETASRSNQLPYFWASSILVGNNGVIEMKRNDSWLKKSGIVASSILVIIFCWLGIRILRGRRFSQT